MPHSSFESPWKTDMHGIYPQTAGAAEKKKKSKRQKSVWFSSFPRIFRFWLLCRTDVFVVDSRSVLDAENDGKVRFTLCWVVVEEGIASTCSICSIVVYAISQQLLDTEKNGLCHRSQCEKLSGETITKTSILQSSKNRKIRGNGENRILFSLFLFFPRIFRFGYFVEHTF